MLELYDRICVRFGDHAFETLSMCFENQQTIFFIEKYVLSKKMYTPVHRQQLRLLLVRNQI